MSEGPAERLRRVRLAAGFETAADAARRFGWNERTYDAHENGNRGIRAAVAAKYARAFRVDASEILGLSMGSSTPARLIQIVGDAAVGVWRDANLTTLMGQKGADALTIPVLQELGSAMQGAVRVVDASMNKVFQVGEFAIFSEVEELADLDRYAGKVVYVERRRGDLIERSLRLFSKRKDGMHLECFSTEARFVESVPYPSKRPDEDVRIVGIVVGRYATLGSLTTY